MKSNYIFLLLTLFVIAKNDLQSQILEPYEIINIQKKGYPLINNMLKEKGFGISNTLVLNDKDTSYSWAFWINGIPEENGMGSLLTKYIDALNSSRIIYNLYNPYHYKIFVENLIKEKYKFKGVEVIQNKIHSVFTNGTVTFRIVEIQFSEKKSYYEIVLGVTKENDFSIRK